MTSTLLELVRRARIIRRVVYVNGAAGEAAVDAEIAAAEARGWIGPDTIVIRKFSLSVEKVAVLNSR